MPRTRKMVKFWLDMKHADQEAMSIIVEDLRQRRQLARTIRDGIRLVCDLRAGNIDVLLELFPWVGDALHRDPVISTEQRLQAQIARLEALLVAQGNVPLQPASRTANALTSGVPIQTRKSAKVEVSAMTGKASAETVAKNFLSSMKGLASGFFD